MSKKIFDIKPPEAINKLQKDPEVFSQKEILNNNVAIKYNFKDKTKDSKENLEQRIEDIEDNEENIFKKADAKRKKPSKHHKKNDNFLLKALAVAGIFLVILAVYLFFKLPKTQVEIWPKTESLNYKETIIAEISSDIIDLDNKIIPAEYLQDEIEYTEEFSATGNASNEGKAGGTITIYNKCDFLKPVVLKAETHFISDSNKYFKILSKATIPAGVKSGGKIIPGSVDVKVEASEGGENYNIKPANFSVPKFAGTIYYHCIYAQSKEQMNGGFSSAVKKVTQDDIQYAKDTLGGKILSDAETLFKSKISTDYILFNDAIKSQISSESSDTKAGTVIDKFKYSVKAKTGCLVFKKSDLEKLAKDYIFSKMPETQNLLEESFNITYTPELIDTEGGKITINIEFSALTYPDIDKNLLTYSLRRKTSEQINETINGSEGDKISKIKVNFWPFWVTKSPKNQKAIEVELKFE